MHQILRYIVVIGKQLLGVFGQAVAAVTKRRVIVMAADARVQADTVDDIAGVQSAHLGVGVQLVKIGHAQR